MLHSHSPGISARRSVWMLIAPLLLACTPALAQQTFGCASACTSNGGRCSQELNSQSYFCDCSGTGRTGTNCETVASNATSPASNSSTPATSSGVTTCPVACINGRCTQDINGQSYYCQCSSGFTGASCNAATAPAGSPPATANTTGASSGTFACPVECANGQCTQELNSNTYYCECNAGFTGSACKAGSASAPATASSTPATAAGTFTCPVACKNGQCLQQLNSDTYYCNCTAGFTGSDCSSGSASAKSPATAVTAASTAGCNVNCKNRGSCKPVLNSAEYYCECPSGYTGWDCGISTGSTASGATSSGGSQQHGGRTLEGWKIFVIVLAALVGSIMAASVAYIIWRQRRTPATFVKFTDGDLEGQPEIEIRRNSTTS